MSGKPSYVGFLTHLQPQEVRDERQEAEEKSFTTSADRLVDDEEVPQDHDLG